MSDEYDWREHWEPRTKGGHEVLCVACRNTHLVGLIDYHKEATKVFWNKDAGAAGVSWLFGGERTPELDLIPIAPPPPRLTATELCERGVVGRLHNTGGTWCIGPLEWKYACPAAAVLWCAGLGVESSIERGQSTWEYKLPGGEWRPLSEVDLTR